MKEIDFNRAGMLLTVMEKCATVGPMMTNISGEAGEELKAINKDCIDNARERADKIRAEEQIAEQKRLEAVRAHDEENAQPRGPIQPPDAKPYMPGQPVDRPVGEPSPTDRNRNGIEDVQEDKAFGQRHPQPPIVERRL